ncbi:S9 family peptidase [Sphingomonas sp. AP4-R1]|uniref:S9 family peptidase n=1 Tax=Sphingomonas sp. AP4-R1 TaxID=2735134 RepID=UPI0014933D94|nr:S9 family peptidase [Sphingomonas sp. AP4-R1]QJU58012.1 S9 family peptidase [Sphingomonas sp. AP4-R1]
MFALIAAAALAPAATPAKAAPVPSAALAKYAALAMDASGKRIATVDSLHAAGAPAAGHGIVTIRDTTGRARPMGYDPCDVCRYDGLSWSPDGKTLAFVASGRGEATLYRLDGGTVARVTSVKGLMANPRWSADGRTIAFLATIDAAKETGAAMPGVRQVGVIGEKNDSRRIATVPALGGAPRLISPEGTFVYEYDWTPDGRGFVGTAAEGNGDNQWWVASLRAFPIDGAMRTLAAPKLQMNFPRVAPDGASIAFIGGLMSDFGSVGGDVYVVPIAGGTPRNVTPGYAATFTSLVWRGTRLIAGVTQGGSTGTAVIDPAKGVLAAPIVAARTIDAGDGRVALDRSGVWAAAVAEDYATPPRILFGPLNNMKPISHENDAIVSTNVATDIRWRNAGRQAQGWLLAPSATVPADKAPMITIVHGGPASAATPRFPWTGPVASFLKAGYWVFQPNPRGSYGQGAAFVRANVRDFGGGDLSDILAGIDAVEKQAPIDDARLGVYGHSYGGFMTMWTVTHSQRFKAAVAGAGIGDWVAYYGQNGIDQWMIPYFGASAYDEPGIYDKLSPVRYVRAAKTPTLMYVGERDVETPAAQSLEFWHGLKAMNVPTELVIYADEGHAIRDPKNLADQETRMLGWFDRYLKK